MAYLIKLILFTVLTFQAVLAEEPPVNYGVVVYPGFQMLDVFGPLDILYMVSRENYMNVSIIAATKDPISSHPGANFSRSPFAAAIQPTHTFENAPTDLEVLIIPGGNLGLGTRTTSNIAPVEAYIKKVYPNLRFVITVCTGSALLARTGLLDGRRATSNKWAWSWVTSQGPKIRWVPKARWVVDEQPGKVPIWTSSGVTAGFDATFAFVKTWYGDALAEQTAGIFEYERHTDAAYDPFSTMWKVPGA